MRKGSTPTLEFTVPFNKKMISKARVLFGYGSSLILKKEMDDLEISDNLIKTTLSQEETFLFISDCEADIQLRILTPDKVSFVSNVLKMMVEKCLDEEVL